jgi:DNA modification methylase
VLPLLEKGSVDLVLTDPPYELQSLPFSRDIASSLAVFGYGPVLLRWFRVWQEPDAWVTWWPTNGACRGGFGSKVLNREAEHIAIFGTLSGNEVRVQKSHSVMPSRWGMLNSRKCSDVWRDAAPGLGFNSHQRKHRNEKPVTIIERLVLLCGGNLILDPFAGSGTTGRACKDLGRRCIMIEIEERYCEIAKERLKQEVFSFA